MLACTHNKNSSNFINCAESKKMPPLLLCKGGGVRGPEGLLAEDQRGYGASGSRRPRRALEGVDD